MSFVIDELREKLRLFTVACEELRWQVEDVIEATHELVGEVAYLEDYNDELREELSEMRIKIDKGREMVAAISKIINR